MFLPYAVEDSIEIQNHVDVEKNFEFQHITSDKIEKNYR